MKSKNSKKDHRRLRRKLIFLVGLDEYFLSHRQPASRAAMQLGYSVTVVAKDTGKRSMIEALGCRFIENPIPNASSNAFTTALSIMKFRRIIDVVRPTWRPSLFHYHLKTMKVAGPVKPGILHLACDRYHQRITLPCRIRVTHPSVDLRYDFRLVDINNSI